MGKAYIYILLLVNVILLILATSTFAQETIEESDSKEISADENVKEDYVEDAEIPTKQFDVAPDSIPQQLSDLSKIRPGIFKLDPFGRLARRWRKLNEKLDGIGLDLGIAYTVLYQGATSATREEKKRNAAGGVFDFFGLWNFIDRDGMHPGYIGFRSSWKHSIGDIPPSDLGDNIGSLWRTEDGFNIQAFFMSQLWWQQHLFNDLIIFRIGKVDQNDFFDSYKLSSAKLFFVNGAFSSNPTIAYPGNGLGGAIAVRPFDIFYILAGIGDANGRSSSFDFSTFFDEREYFSGLELGLVPAIDGLGKADYHIAFWHRDEIKKEEIPKGSGLAITLQQDVAQKMTLFLRYSFTNGSITNVRQLFSGGVSIYDPFGETDEVLGLAFAWGEPEDKSLRSQSVIEFFYRTQLFPEVQLTPDIQLIINPSNAPEKDIIAVFGIRIRIAF